MKQKKRIFIGLIGFSIMLFLLGCGEENSADGTVPADVQPKTLDEYRQGIDFSCSTDTDCGIKDLHNCCGYYPSCMNKNSFTDPAFVKEKCAESGLVSVCGYPSIDECRCVNARCEGYSDIE